MEELITLNALGSHEKTHEKIITYVGGITKERGIFELLKAIEGTDIKLYLAGTPTPKTLLNALQKEKGWENVTYFGHVDRKEICSIFLKSQVGICVLHPTASYINSLPIKLFEYMSAGLPIVASNFPYWQELLADLNNIRFVDPLNPEEIRMAVNTLIADRNECYSMGARGSKAVKEKFNWALEEKKLISFYGKLGVRAVAED